MMIGDVIFGDVLIVHVDGNTLLHFKIILLFQYNIDDIVRTIIVKTRTRMWLIYKIFKHDDSVEYISPPMLPPPAQSCWRGGEH